MSDDSSRLQECALDLGQILRAAIENDASDIHLVVGEPLLLRTGSSIERTMGSPVLRENDLERIIYPLISERQRDLFLREHELDFSYDSLEITNARFRVNLGLENKGIYATFRIIPKQIRDIETIGFPNPTVWNDIVSLNRGLVLVTGVTGSGKSTTLASLINRVNHESSDKIITIEDPIEYLHPNQKSIVVQREVGRDTNSFAAGVKWSLRQDPDIILIGEIRDPETARAALTAAETGHLVFSTLHTKDAAGTINRFVELFPTNEHSEIRNALSYNLAWVLSQQLIPYERGANRVIAMEVMRNTFPMSTLIRGDKISQIHSVMQTSTKDGMITMDKHLAQLYRDGKVSYNTAVFYASNRSALTEDLSRSKEE